MSNSSYDFIIIGAGFSGICMGIKLRQAGIDNFIILERNSHLGGTWWDNNYPGAACDVQSHLYSFSFEPNPGWSRQFSPQQEILHYLEHCAAKYDLGNHFQFNTNVTGAFYNENSCMWRVTTGAGTSYFAPIVISCSGGLSQPASPDIKGLQNFKGDIFHSSRWDRNFDLVNKTVAVIGTGASAIQIVPAIAGRVKQLYLFQRTPPWILPKPDRKVTGFEHKIFRWMPFTQYLYRIWMYWVHEMMALAFVVNPRIMKLIEKLALRYLKKSVKNDSLRKKLTPNYVMGCKRILLSNDYYPALQRKNVEVVTDGINEINATGILANNKEQKNVDAIILATGFHAAEGVVVFDIKGRNGMDINGAWRNGAEAYLGTSIAGFPNLFLIVGPNTGLGHSSMILMIEAQVHYIMEAVKSMKKDQTRFIDVKPGVQKAFNENLQQQLGRTVWQSGGCHSWYQTSSGKNVTLWPGFTFTFMKRTKKFEPEKYEMG